MITIGNCRGFSCGTFVIKRFKLENSLMFDKLHLKNAFNLSHLFSNQKRKIIKVIFIFILKSNYCCYAIEIEFFTRSLSHTHLNSAYHTTKRQLWCGKINDHTFPLLSRSLFLSIYFYQHVIFN